MTAALGRPANARAVTSASADAGTDTRLSSKSSARRTRTPRVPSMSSSQRTSSIHPASVTHNTADQCIPIPNCLVMNTSLRSLREWLVAMFVALCVVPGTAKSMDFSIVSVNSYGDHDPTFENRFILMKGEIRPGDYDRLLAFAVREGVDLTRGHFILSSPGGDVSEALKLGRLIKSLYVSVGVGPHFGPCASACFIMYASAVDRIAGSGLLGIHRPYVSPERVRSLSPAAAEVLETRALTDAEAYMHALRVPNSLVEIMFEQASTQVHWLTHAELDQLGMRAPWYEEFLIARCGLNKDTERKLMSDPEHLTEEGHAAISRVFSCASKLTHPEAVANFDRALKLSNSYGFDAKTGFYRPPPPEPPPDAVAASPPVQYSVKDIVVGECYIGGTNYFHVVEIANGMVSYVEHDYTAEAIHHPSTWKRRSISIQQFVKQVSYNCADYEEFPGVGS
jgi:hypothetical protein